MSHLFTMLDFAVPDNTLPQLAATDFELLVDYEPDAYEHWALGGNATCLAGLAHGKMLTPQASSHVFNANSVAIDGSVGNALVSDLPDGPELTMCAVLKLPALANAKGIVPFGCAGTSDGGSALLYYTTSGGYTLGALLRGSTTPGSMAFAGEAAGDWVFFGMSQSFTGDNVLIRAGSLLTANTAPITGEKTHAAANIAIGNSRYSTPTYDGDFEAAEFIIYNRALSAAELAAVYSRSKGRLARRGITVR